MVTMLYGRYPICIASCCVSPKAVEIESLPQGSRFLIRVENDVRSIGPVQVRPSIPDHHDVVRPGLWDAVLQNERLVEHGRPVQARQFVDHPRLARSACSRRHGLPPKPRTVCAKPIRGVGNGVQFPIIRTIRTVTEEAEAEPAAGRPDAVGRFPMATEVRACGEQARGVSGKRDGSYDWPDSAGVTRPAMRGMRGRMRTAAPPGQRGRGPGGRPGPPPRARRSAGKHFRHAQLCRRSAVRTPGKKLARMTGTSGRSR